MSIEFRFAVNVTPKPGILDPQGRAVEGSLGHLGIAGVVRGARRATGRADRRRPPTRPRARAIVERLGRELLSNPLIEAYAVELARGDGSDTRRRRLVTRIGVVVFPGSNCDRTRCAASSSRAPSRSPLWHEQASLDGVAAVVLPGGFAYGDYLRAGVIARFSPVMRGVAAFAGDGGLVLGICNGFQVLAEAGLVPGRAAAQPRPAVPRAATSGSGRATRHAVHRCLAGSAARSACRSRTARAATTPTTATLDALERDGQVLFRYVHDDGAPAADAGDDRRTRTAASGRSPACQRPRQRGRADAASGARRRGDPRLG